MLCKNNSDGKGQQLRLSRELSRCALRSVRADPPGVNAVPRDAFIFAGSGRSGAENGDQSADYPDLTARRLFETLVDLNTMVRRPIINTRMEPHSDSARYRRLHVIVGDADMASVPTYLRSAPCRSCWSCSKRVPNCPRSIWKIRSSTIVQVSRDMRVQESLETDRGSSSHRHCHYPRYLKTAQREVLYLP